MTEGDMGEIEGKLDDMHQMCMMYTRINGSPRIRPDSREMFTPPN